MSHISNYPKRGGQPVSPFSFPIPYIIYIVQQFRARETINSTHPRRGLKPTAIDDPHGIRVGMDGVPAIHRRAMHGVKTPYER